MWELWEVGAGEGGRGRVGEEDARVVRGHPFPLHATASSDFSKAHTPTTVIPLDATVSHTEPHTWGPNSPPRLFLSSPPLLLLPSSPPSRPPPPRLTSYVPSRRSRISTSGGFTNISPSYL